MNRENYKQVLHEITEHPDKWDQTSWHRKRLFGLCGSSHCFAGWAQLLSGRKAHDASAATHARLWLELTPVEALYLFDVNRTMEDFYTFLEADMAKDSVTVEELEAMVNG